MWRQKRCLLRKARIYRAFLLPKRRFFSVPKHRCKIAVFLCGFCTERRGLPFYRNINIHHGNRRYTHGNTYGNHETDTLSALPQTIQRIYRKRGKPHNTYINEKHRARFTLAARNVHKENYAVLSALYLLTADLVPPMLFRAICNAMAIRRFSISAIQNQVRPKM